MENPSLESSHYLAAVDIGNSSIQLGLFTRSSLQKMASPPVAGKHVPLALRYFFPNELEKVASFLSENLSEREAIFWAIGSVAPDTLLLFQSWLSANRPNDSLVVVDHHLVPLKTEVSPIERVGIDRLLATYAVTLKKSPASPAIVVDSGTALTIEAISAESIFLGGAILPGLRLSAEALGRGTAHLPLLPTNFSQKPPVIGTNTELAIQSGLYHQAIGSAKEVVLAIAQNWKSEGYTGPIEIYFAGGNGAFLSDSLADTLPKHFLCHHCETLVLQGLLFTLGLTPRATS
ncbi:MAG: type III pantothenate kinase [Pirellulaceae bacterium]|nr:type III pantothenate kinase [Pirellulaceae bacterium]